MAHASVRFGGVSPTHAGTTGRDGLASERKGDAMLQALAKCYLAVSRWKFEAAPLRPGHAMIIGAPHTSNWDGIFMAIALWRVNRPFRFLVKDSATKGPLGVIVRGVGGIAVNRKEHNGIVEQISKAAAADPNFTLCITPKGTRSPREYWKSGFYRIAWVNKMPIYPGFVDRSTMTFGWGEPFYLTGDVKADMDKIREIYKDRVGVRPEKVSVPRLRAEDDDDAREYLLRVEE